MATHFDVNSAELIEFGVGLDDDKGERYVLLPIDEEIQGALREMVEKTRSELAKASDIPKTYEPTEKHAGKENLRLPLSSELAQNIRLIHEATNINKEPTALSNPNAVFCYFTRMTNSKGRRLTAIRKASGFMGILKNRNHFVRLLNDSLELVDDNLFKLDRDFDLLVDGDEVQILRHTTFEMVGKLESEIKKAVPKNLEAISADLPFVDFAGIAEYAEQHSRAARSIASIRDQQIKKINQTKLKKECAQFKVKTKVVQGKLVVEAGSIMNFLYLLDRRLYRIDLTDSPESYLAASRSKIT